MVDSWNALCMLSGTEGDGKPRHPKPRVNKRITFQCFSKKIRGTRGDCAREGFAKQRQRLKAKVSI